MLKILCEKKEIIMLSVEKETIDLQVRYTRELRMEWSQFGILATTITNSLAG